MQFVETDTIEEISEALASLSLIQQDPVSTHCGRDPAQSIQQTQCVRDDPVTSSQHLSSDEVAPDDDNTYCIVCCNSFPSAVAFAEHIRMARYAPTAQKLTKEEIERKYYHLVPMAKLEIFERELPMETGVAYPELSSVTDLYYNQNKDSVIKMQDCPQLMTSRTITEAESDTVAPLRTDQHEIDILPRTFTATSRNETTEVQTNQYYEMYATKELPLDLSSKRRRKFKEEERHAIIIAKKKKTSCSNIDNTKSSADQSITTHENEFKSSQEPCSSQSFIKHTNINKFSCSFCNFKCNYQSALKTHTRIHTGEKPFACNVCDYRCIQKSYLKVHMKTHTSAKPFACDMCHHECKLKSNLKKHMLTHTGEKKFACGVCSYRCIQKSNLKVHMRIHTGEKPFACSMCDYKCNAQSKLSRHMKTHTR